MGVGKGRNRKPTALRVLEGNPRREPLPVGEPKPAADNVHAPEWLDELAAQEWRELAPSLQACKLLTNVDVNTLGLACTAIAEVRRCRSAMEGLELGSDEYERFSNRELKHMREYRGFIGHFGLSPASRASLGVQPARQKNRLLELIATGRERRQAIES